MKRASNFHGPALFIAGALLFSGRVALAHGTYFAVAPRLAPGAPVPVFNGVCRPDEYSPSLRYSILYRPRFDWNPATLYLLTTSTDLYVCVSGMPLNLGSSSPFVSVTVDTRHDGGRVPGTDDLYFILRESGGMEANRGDGAGGLVAAPDLSGWTALRADGVDGLSWSAEYRIPLTLLGGATPLTVAGIQVRHNRLRSDFDDFVWPARAEYTVPNTWADLIWGAAPSGPGTIRVDVSRITQGLEQDVTGGVLYDAIAGKDTLIRAQLYQFGTPALVASAVCKLQQTTAFGPFDVRVPVSGPVQTVPVSFGAAPPRVNSVAHGFFTGLDSFNCWVPGSFLGSAGDYRFWMEVRYEGAAAAQSIDLGVRTFVRTADLRLMLFRAVFPMGHPEFLPWNAELLRSVSQTMSEVQRMMPLRAPVGTFDRVGLPRTGSTPGLRFFTHPTIYQCVQLDGETMPQAVTRCDREFRSRAFEFAQEENARLRALDSVDGRTRDRIDFEYNVISTPSTGGGQAQYWSATHCSGGSGLDPSLDGASGSVAVQEISHCLEQVRQASPHSDCPPASENCRGSHSRTSAIPLFRGLSMVHMSRRQDRTPYSVMNPTVGLSPDFIHEGWEWNDLRRTLLSLPRPSRVLEGPAPRGAQPLFKLAGTLDPNGVLAVRASARVDGLELDLTPMSQGSPYALVFLGAGDVELGRLPFEVSFENSGSGDHGDSGAGLFLVAPLPPGSAGIEVRRDAEVLHALDFSPNAPKVTSVSVTPNQQGPGFLVQWSASDADLDNLSYSLRLETSKDVPPLLLTSGLSEKSYLFDPDVMLGAQQARVLVEAGDGYHTASAASAAFALPAPPPYEITILAPTQGAQLVAGQPILLSGAAFEYGTGGIEREALHWTLDQGTVLGDGEQIEVVLAPGEHVLTAANAVSERQTSIASVDVTVLADSDGDALPDTYEAQHACLASSTADGSDDPDADELASRGEMERGTDPCAADSDLDGFSDGDEVRLSSDPLDAQSLPDPDLLFLAEGSADLGACPSPGTVTIEVQSDAAVPWSVASGADWLTVAGGGTGDGTITLEADCNGLVSGSYRAEALVSIDGGQPRLVEAWLHVPGPVVTRAEFTPLACLLLAAALGLAWRRRMRRG